MVPCVSSPPAFRIVTLWIVDTSLPSLLVFSFGSFLNNFSFFGFEIAETLWTVRLYYVLWQ